MSIYFSNPVTDNTNKIRIFLRLISLTSFILLVSFLFLSWYTEWNPFFWTITQYLGPIIYLGIWIPFAASFLDLELKSISFKRTFPIIIFGSILVVFGAILLNTRLMYIIFNALTSLFNMNTELDEVSSFIVQELILGIFGPLNEELIKIIPILVITRTSIVFFNPENDDLKDFDSKSSLMSNRQIAFYGIISGTIFTFFELFLYQWQLFGVNEANFDIFIQILLRTTAPLHVWTTFIIALGIGSFKGRLAENQKFSTAFFSFLGYFIIGWSFHAFWNSLNVFFGVFYPDESMFLFGSLFVLGIIITILLFFCLIAQFKTTPYFCSHCGYEERGIHSHHSPIKSDLNKAQVRFTHIPSFLRFFSHIRKKKLIKKLSCPFCFNPLILGTCSDCGTRTFVVCPNCNGFISETTAICPHCKIKIKPLIELRNKTLSWPETIILGVCALSSMTFLLAPITVLLFGQLDSFGAMITPFLVFYFLMSITVLLNIVIALFLNRTTGILVLFCLFLQFILLMFTILGSMIIIGLFRAFLTFDVLGLGVLLLGGVSALFLGYFVYNVFFLNYSPLFSEYNLDYWVDQISEDMP